jgi:hypothetical protein
MINWAQLKENNRNNGIISTCCLKISRLLTKYDIKRTHSHSCEETYPHADTNTKAKL